MTANPDIRVFCGSKVYLTLGLTGASSKSFEEKYDYKFEVMYAGTGEDLDIGREGKVDLVIVHTPEAEEEFVDSGYGVNRSHITLREEIDPEILTGGNPSLINHYHTIATKPAACSREPNKLS